MGVPLAPTWTVINELGGPHFKKITVVSSTWMVRDAHPTVCCGWVRMIYRDSVQYGYNCA